MYLSDLRIRNHPILKNLELDLTNPKTNKPYAVVAFVGENGCGKTTLLNELFDYEKSEFLVDKQRRFEVTSRPFNALYLRQGSLHRNAMREVRKLMDGKDMYPTNSASSRQQSDPSSLRSENVVAHSPVGIRLLEKLGDEEITKLFRDHHIDEVWCSGEVTEVIDGKNHGYPITDYSSGQQEILLKLKDIRQMASGTDWVLLDEPETSLHPRWQKEIVSLIESMLSDGGNAVPQIFLATHSEKVLESLITRDDVLIVRLSKTSEGIKAERINEMDLRLPTPTFAELDYVVFHIPSLDYHDQLLSRMADLFEAETISQIDKAVRKHPLYTKQEFGKVWVGANSHQVIEYRTLSVYIRNYFHHPKEGMEPSEDEVVKSIELLRSIIQLKTAE